MAVLLAITFAVIVHEAGHLLAARALGYATTFFARLPWSAGIAVRGPVHRGDDALIALSGPLASTLLAIVASALGFEMLAVCSSLLGLLNLLPLPGSDGMRLMKAAWR